MKTGLTLFVVLVAIVAFLCGVFGYFYNAYRILQLDFNAPYKAEVLRIAGVFMPPLGAVEGLFVTFDEDK